MKNFKEFMEEMDSDENPRETRADIARRKFAAAKEKTSSTTSQSPSAVKFTKSKGQLPRLFRKKVKTIERED
tara:strand:+ start:204 stop:419 length:216 start_codon:yes stop_codon:yes gene_type:complete